MTGLKNKKVLFLDPTHQRLIELLEKDGFVCDLSFQKSREDVLSNIHEYAGVIIRSRIHIDKDFIDKATNLQFIGRVGAGMESIDVAFAEARGIRCFNSPEGNRDAVGEHAIGLMLALMNNFLKADKQVRNGEWNREQNRGIEIKGKTIGILGYGNMGSAFARKLKGFETNVIAYDKYKFNYSDEFVKEVSMDEIFENADILSLHVPLTDETRYLFNTKYINKFKKDFWLINTSRGTIVKTDDLVSALKSGKVKGAALDVIEYEETSFEKLKDNKLPEAFEYLMKSDKVILTPHIAGWTEESKIKLAEVLAEKIINFARTIQK